MPLSAVICDTPIVASTSGLPDASAPTAAAVILTVVERYSITVSGGKVVAHPAELVEGHVGLAWEEAGTLGRFEHGLPRFAMA